MIRLRLRRGCREHREALLEFAAQRGGGPDVRRALDHVDRCPTCEEELAATTLVLHALRRLHEETVRAEPAGDSWARLRARLAATRREPSRLLSGLPGIVVAAGLCAALVGPGAIVGGRSTRVYNESPRSVASPGLQFEASRERAYSEGLLPLPTPQPRAIDARNAQPRPAADLPLSMHREVVWIDEVVATVPAAPAAAAAADAAASPDRQEVSRTRT